MSIDRMTFSLDDLKIIINILIALTVSIITAAVGVMATILKASTDYQRSQLSLAMKNLDEAADLRSEQYEDAISYSEARIKSLKEQIVILEVAMMGLKKSLEDCNQTVAQLTFKQEESSNARTE